MEESFDNCNYSKLLVQNSVTLTLLPPSLEVQAYWISIPAPVTYVSSALCTDDKKISQRVGCGKGNLQHFLYKFGFVVKS